MAAWLAPAGLVLPVGWAPREPTGAKATHRGEFCSEIHRSGAWILAAQKCRA